MVWIFIFGGLHYFRILFSEGRCRALNRSPFRNIGTGACHLSSGCWPKFSMHSLHFTKCVHIDGQRLINTSVRYEKNANKLYMYICYTCILVFQMCQHIGDNLASAIQNIHLTNRARCRGCQITDRWWGHYICFEWNAWTRVTVCIEIRRANLYQVASHANSVRFGLQTGTRAPLLCHSIQGTSNRDVITFT